MPLKVATTTGIYYAARSEELANAINKLGYALTRGAGAIEIAADVAHEVPYTHGVQIRHMAKKQGVEILFHGDLTVPFEMPERGEWRDAQDRLTKSIRSAVYAGSKYVNFHACLNIWLELITYAGRKLTMAFCDHHGTFISKILKENAKLRDWFVDKKLTDYARDVLTRKEMQEADIKASIEAANWRKRETVSRLKAANIPDEIIDLTVLREITPTLPPELRHFQKTIDDVLNKLREDSAIKNVELDEQYLKNAMRKKLASGGKWESEELRAVVGVLDGYHIMGHHLFYTKDPQWVSMAKEYPDVMSKYSLDYSDDRWLDKAWERAESENDRVFKEFFYAAIAAKYVEGHLEKAIEWINKEFIGKEIAKLPDQKEREELTHIAKNLIIALETPDAREPQHAGLYFLFRPKQIHSVVKTMRSVLKTERIMTIIDHEHVATQGLDALTESNETIKTNPDLGEIMICVHANHPNPLQPHMPIELGDELLYKLLYNLRVTGLGKKRLAYLLFERGGGEDPFKKSIESLKIMAKFLEKDIHPDSLPLEFYGIKGEVAGSERRQLQIIRDHMYEPLKDLLEMPEEEWTMLSQGVLRKGKKSETWKRGEFR